MTADTCTTVYCTRPVEAGCHVCSRDICGPCSVGYHALGGPTWGARPDEQVACIDCYEQGS